MNYESSYSDSLGDSRFDKIQKQEEHTVGKVISKIDMKWVYFTNYGLILIYKTMRWFFYTLGGHPSGVTFSSGALGFLMNFGLFSLILYVIIYAPDDILGVCLNDFLDQETLIFYEVTHATISHIYVPTDQSY